MPNVELYHLKEAILSQFTAVKKIVNGTEESVVSSAAKIAEAEEWVAAQFDRLSTGLERLNDAETVTEFKAIVRKLKEVASLSLSCAISDYCEAYAAAVFEAAKDTLE